MKFYNFNELKNKSYEELFQIVKEENISYNKYYLLNYTLSRNELIKIILKYRKKEDNIDYSKFSIYEIQNYLDLYFEEDFLENNDVIVPISISLFKGIDFINNIEKKIFIEKNSSYSNLVFIVNDNNYIYAIGELEFIKENEDFLEYSLIINFENIRIDFELENNMENYYLLFLKENIDLNSKEKIKGVKKLIKDFKYSLPIDYEYSKYIYFNSSNIVISNNIFKDNFLCKNINEGEYLLFENSYMLKNNFNFSNSYSNLYKFEEVLREDKDIFYIFDINNIFRKISKKELLKILFLKTKRILSSIENKKVENIYYVKEVGDNSNINSFKYNSLFFVNYYYLKESLDKKEYDSSPYLVIFVENNTFSISENRYLIFEKRQRYNINLESKVLILSNNYTYNNIISKITMFLKQNIEFHSIYKGNDKFNVLSKKEELNRSYYFTKVNDVRINNEYIEESLNEVSKNIFNFLLYNKFDENLIRKTIFERITIDFEYLKDVIKEILEKDLELFFKNNSIIDILKKYRKIKIVGELTNTNIFYSSLKEYIPGKMIDKIKSNINIFQEIFDEYEKDIKFGKVNVNYKYFNKVSQYILKYINYKGEQQEILNTKESNYAFFDLFKKTEKISFKIDDLDYEESINKEIKIVKDYEEKDENIIIEYFKENYEIDIEKNNQILNDLKDDIIRIIVIFKEKKFIFLTLTRENNQTYISNSYFLSCV